MEPSSIFNWSLIYATIRSSTPILFAALCATITQQGNITNIGTEGIMLISAFTAVVINVMTGSWIIAVLVSILSGVILALIMAVGNIRYNADITAIGIGINMLALAFTKFGIKQWLGTTGSFSSPDIKPIPKIHIAAFDDIPFVNEVLNNWSIMEVFGILMVFFIYYLLYRTVWGLRVRSVGFKQEAAETAGIHVKKMQYQVMIISGIMGGLAGAHLSTGYSQMFVENMTNGRGFMGVAAMFFGGANPIFAWIGSLLFGFIDSLGSRLQAQGWPSQFVLMLPYVITIVILSISMWQIKMRRIRQASSLMGRSGKRDTLWKHKKN